MKNVMQRRVCHFHTSVGSLRTRAGYLSVKTAFSKGCSRFWTSSASICSCATLQCATRLVHYRVDAACFESEVIQSEQALCVVYHIPNNNCIAYLRTAEMLVDKINAAAAGNMAVGAEESARGLSSDCPPEKQCDLVVEVESTDGRKVPIAPPTEGSGVVDSSRKHTPAWLKLCTINADENRNLASAFSVERAKLPVTYFIMQGTIVDKVIGNISAMRLEGILVKFLEHYQQELNVDLLSRKNKESEGSKGISNPLPAAATADLIRGTSTQFLLNRVLTSLVGSEMIRLPEEAEQLDGLRKTLQQAKRKAYDELNELYRQLGMDVRKLSDTELHAHYYKSSAYQASGILSALEGLYLARVYASLGDIPRENAEFAKRAVLKDYQVIIGEPNIRRILALTDANLVRGDLRMAAVQASNDFNALKGLLAAYDQDDPSAQSAREASQCVQKQLEHTSSLLELIEDHVDTRTSSEGFPSAVVQRLFERLADNQKRSQEIKREKVREVAADRLVGDILQRQSELTDQRVQQVRVILMCILQLHIGDPKSQAARARLSSLLY